MDYEKKVKNIMRKKKKKTTWSERYPSRNKRYDKTEEKKF